MIAKNRPNRLQDRLGSARGAQCPVSPPWLAWRLCCGVLGRSAISFVLCEVPCRRYATFSSCSSFPSSSGTARPRESWPRANRRSFSPRVCVTGTPRSHALLVLTWRYFQVVRPKSEQTDLTIIHCSSVRMTRTVTRLASVEITAACVRCATYSFTQLGASIIHSNLPTSPPAWHRWVWTETFADSARCKSKTSAHRVRRE